jgi:phenylpropionate dioxygenase-like ring-hydroxylating dioxygenase large terminal subunit
MNKTVMRQTPESWDRRGLPAWTYHSQSLFDLERTELFLNHWQIAGHVSDIPGPGDWMTFDFLDERALVIRDRDSAVRAFHNLCRHRGARLVAGESGRCRSALVCPFHGWVYNTDGTLRGPSRPETFGDFDRSEFGLKPVEMEIWNGFVFLRFNPGPQPPVKTLLAPFAADFAAYGAADFLPATEYAWTATLPVNWKSVRDVDNEGYHVAMAHPALQDLYGRSYRDTTYTNGISSSYAEFGDHPGRLWSVRHYLKIAPVQDHLPPRLQRSWSYFGLFPNAVIAFTPESAQYYQEVPKGLGETELRGRTYRRPNETRATRLARYLAYRIDRETGLEDQQLSIWSNESMRSSAFDEFHLSDLEYGVRNHHDQIRRILPVTRLRDAPAEGEVAARNNDLLRAEEISV